MIAATAFSAGAMSMGATAWVTWLKLSVYLVLGETDKIAELANEIPEAIRNSFEIGAIVGAIAQALSMIFEWIAEKISTLWGKAKDWFKGTSTPAPTEATANPATITESGTSAVPQEAKDIAAQVESRNGAAPQGYRGGRTYRNIPVNEGDQLLPEGVNYREYDIHPYVRGQNRGAERIVIGDDGSVWYTNDHYHTFTKIE